MSAVISVAGDRVWMSTGAAEAVRLGIVAYLREQQIDGTPLAARVIAGLELMWPADLFDDLPPYDEPAVRALLAPAWLALARDVARDEPRLVREVAWAALDREWRIVWVAWLLRIARGWTGVDLGDEITSGWSEWEKAVLRVHLAEADVMRAWHALVDEPTAERRADLAAALDTKLALARAADPALARAVERQHASVLLRADERLQRG